MDFTGEWRASASSFGGGGVGWVAEGLRCGAVGRRGIRGGLGAIVTALRDHVESLVLGYPLFWDRRDSVCISDILPESLVAQHGHAKP